MHTCVRFIAVSLFVLGAGAGCASGRRHGDDGLAAARRAVEATNAQMADALKRGNAAEAAATFTEDAVLLASTEVRGRAAISAYYAGAITSLNFQDVVFTTDELNVVGNTAYELGRSSITFRSGGQNLVTQRARYLTVWQRQKDGAWRMHRVAISAGG